MGGAVRALCSSGFQSESVLLDRCEVCENGSDRVVDCESYIVEPDRRKSFGSCGSRMTGVALRFGRDIAGISRAHVVINTKPGPHSNVESSTLQSVGVFLADSAHRAAAAKPVASTSAALMGPINTRSSGKWAWTQCRIAASMEGAAMTKASICLSITVAGSSHIMSSQTGAKCVANDPSMRSSQCERL